MTPGPVTGRVTRIPATAIGAILVATMSIFAHGQRTLPGGDVAGGEGNQQGTIWVVNRDRGELAVFDVRTGEVVATVPVGTGAHDIAISEQARKAYITAEADNAVTVVDTRTLATMSIPVAPLPHHVEASHDGRTVYVSLASHTPAQGTPAVAVIDTRTDTVAYQATSTNPAARSHGLFVSPNTDTLYVAHDTGDEVTGVDTESGGIEFSIKPIPRAEEAVATRFGNDLWVSSRGDGSVKRIDLETHTITASVSVGVQPESVMLTPSERTLVVSLRGTPATLAFVDPVTLALIATVQIGGPDTFGDLAVMTANGRYVYATFDAGPTGTGGVAVVDVRRRELITTWNYPGTGRPHGIAYSPRNARF
ncbi:MAG TPA: hypothetical protein VD833_22030 [Vicinamibacterales bacterium]|nr:hypothetical protein [Vicinamibacterales bacterium]